MINAMKTIKGKWNNVSYFGQSIICILWHLTLIRRFESILSNSFLKKNNVLNENDNR